MTREQQFREELSALLNKYNAELSCEDQYSGYPECGHDVRMTVHIPSVYEDYICVHEYCEIDLGNYVG